MLVPGGLGLDLNWWKTRGRDEPVCQVLKKYKKNNGTKLNDVLTCLGGFQYGF